MDQLCLILYILESTRSITTYVYMYMISVMLYYHVYEDFNLEKWPDVYLEKPFKSAILDHNGDRHGCDLYAHNPEFHKTRIEKKTYFLA